VNHQGLSCLSALAVLAGDPEGDPEARLEDHLALAAPEDAARTEAGPDGVALDREGLRAQIARIVQQRRLPGAAVAVVDRDGTWTYAVGTAALESGRPMNDETLFRVGSITKPFISLAILRLVEMGKLRLTDRVRDLAPEIAVKNAWEETDPIRVEHLLEHTSGFDEMRFNEIFEPPRRSDLPLREVLAVNPRSRVARWRPGARFAYSQPGYTLAGYLIEKASGRPFERFLEEEVFQPLGVRGASLRLTPQVRDRLAVGYHKRQPVGEIRLLHRPAGNLMISAEGMARLIELQLGRGQIGGRRFLSPASLDRMERCETVSHAPAPACYGLGNWGDVGGPVPMRGHGGFMPGYLGFYRYIPALGVGYAVLSNDTGAGALPAISWAILQHLLAGTPPHRAPALPGPLPAPERYTGRYRLASLDVEFRRFETDVYAGATITYERGRLVLDLPDWGRFPLVATGSDTFRHPRDSETSIRFSHSAEGRRVFRLRNITFEQESAAWAAARRWALELALLLMFVSPLAPLFFLLSRQREEAAMLLRPAVAAASLLIMATAFDRAHDDGRLGVLCLPTLTVWAASWLFALAAHTGFRRAIGGLRRAEGSMAARACAVVFSAAAVWIALHLSRYGLIGLRTWRW
jgi:CubicO group peptidase (beta-lactamase class C family)